MKLLTMLMAAVFTVAVIAPFSTYACSASAVATAWITSNSTYASSIIAAQDIKRGGYYLTCTGNPDKAMSFRGATSDSLSKYYEYRTDVSASGSVGGSCHEGGGVQDYDCASAGP